MADIKTTVLTVDTGGAITNVKEFKQHIEDLKGKLLGLEKGTEEYNTVAKELKDSQQKLNEVMDVAKGKGEAVKGSYDNLVKTMSELKKQWRATADEAERKQLGKEINSINDQLKELDASTGNYQRNVGNYANSFIGAFGSLSKSISSAVPSVKSFGLAIKDLFKVILTNPIGLLVTAIMGLVQAVKGSEEQFGRLKTALAPVNVLIDAVKNGISALANGFVYLTEKISELILNGLGRLSKILSKLGFEEAAKALTGYIDKTKEYTEKEKENQQLLQRRREINKEIAETEGKVAEIRAKLAEKDKYSTKERLALIDEWEKAERHRVSLETELAQKEYDLIKWKNQQTKSSTAELDAENEAEVRLTRARNAEAESLRNINKERARLLSEMQGSRLEDVIFSTKNGDAEKLRNEIIKFLDDYKQKQAQTFEERKRVIDETYQLNKQRLQDGEQDELKQVEKIKNDRINKLKEYLVKGKISQKDYNSQIEQLEQQSSDEKVKIYAKYDDTRKQLDEAYALQSQKAELDILKDTVNKKLKVIEDTAKQQTLKLKTDFDLSEAENKLPERITSIKGYFESLKNFGNLFTGNDINEWLQRTLDYNNEVLRITKEKNEAIIEENQKIIESYPENSQEYVDAQQRIANAQMEIDNAVTQNHLDNLNAQDEAEQKLADLRDKRVELMQHGMQSVSSLLTSFASLQEQQIKQEVKDGKITEDQAKKKFETVKKLQIASAIVNTASAAMGAYNSVASIPYVGPILGAIAAAAAVAAGAVQIATIKNQQFGSTTSSISTPPVNDVVNEFTPEYTANVTGQSEVTELSNAINSRPAYVSVTDINDVQNKVQVRQEETTY